MSDSETPWMAAGQASLSITSSWSLLKLMPIESVMPFSHLILCRPLLLLPPIPPSIRVFSNESTLHMRWPKYWSFSYSISPSNEYSGLISFRMDWLDLLAVQGTQGLVHWEDPEGLGWGIHVNPWLIHVNVWQKPLQYCKVISLQLIKINGKKKKRVFSNTTFQKHPVFGAQLTSQPNSHIHTWPLEATITELTNCIREQKVWNT